MFSRKVRNKCQKNCQNLLFLFLISIVLSLAGIHVFYFILGIGFYVFVTTLLIEALCVEQIAHGTCAGRIIVCVQTQVFFSLFDGK